MRNLTIPISSRMILFTISLSFFMESVDSTVINTAIPAMARSLQVEPVDLKVALISYLASLAIFIPISGWLADKFGTKKIFMSSLVIFTLSSLWCGFSHNLIELIVARFFQGFGSALGMPVGRLIILRTFGRKNFVTKISKIVSVSALGIMLGPLIGGLITQHFSWHWIFWINIPIGLSAILMALYYLHEKKPDPIHALDKVGFILFGTSLAGFTFGLSALSETTFPFYLAATILILSCVFSLAYYFHSRKRQHPIIKTELLKIRTFQVSFAGNVLSRLGFGSVPFLIPLLLQINFGFSPQMSGALLAPIALGILFSKTFVLSLLRTFGYKRVLLFNTALAGLSIWCFASIHASTPIYLISLLTFVFGMGVSLQYTAMNSLGYADILPEHLSAATSIMGVVQQLAQSLGVAFSALLIRLFAYFFATPNVLSKIVFQCTFLTIGTCTLLSALVFIRLQPEDGQQMVMP